MPSRRLELEQIFLLREVIASNRGGERKCGYRLLHYMVSLYSMLELERLKEVVDSIPGVEQMRDRQGGAV